MPRQNFLLKDVFIANNEGVSGRKPLENSLSVESGPLLGLMLDDIHELTGERDFLNLHLEIFDWPIFPIVASAVLINLHEWSEIVSN